MPIRRAFIEHLAGARVGTADALGLAREQLELTVALLHKRDDTTAARIIALDSRLDDKHHELHRQLLLLLATQQPVASDLRLIAALLQVIRHAERIGDQCVNVAKLIPLAATPPPRSHEVSRCLLEMGERALAETTRAEGALRDNDPTMAQRRREDDEVVNRLNRSCFVRRSRSPTTPSTAAGRWRWSSSRGRWSGSATTRSTSPTRWPSLPRVSGRAPSARPRPSCSSCRPCS